jgi:replicative DNA helicase Mcm
VLKDRTRIRGNIHLLLVGDPSTAKSQIMKLASTMIPRGKYASGTAVSGAGLTATVTRDEQFLGGWVLEAGALVLANKSICALDEFSHVSPQDMIKLQEAMSLETISIAKASIVATLPAQTAILAGANPKFGRFDPYIPIKEQIDINEVILSRFDLRFALKDIPNPEVDEKIADHVMRMRQFEEEAAVPIIEPGLLRKYIAYTRANVHPKLTKESADKIKEFYLQMRARSGEDSPVSITLRQYESLIRLSEASAKVRLSELATIEDAQRAINLMSFSLRQFGFEPETGKIDIDRVEGQRMTAAQRGKTKIMMDVINALESEVGKDIPKDEVVRRAVAEGVEDAEDMLRKLLQMGELYQPNPNFVRKVRE